MSEGRLAEAVSRYAERLHRVIEEDHHVASPLGAWLVLALCGPLAEGPTRAELSEALGMDPEPAALLAGELLEHPHPFVASGAAVWNRSVAETPEVDAWKADLPSVVETGDIPDQQGLDSWAEDHSLGFIKTFPIEVKPETVLILASALATKVSWVWPFDLVPAGRLGAGCLWAGDVSFVLASPERPSYGHSQYIAETEQAGRVAVHVASAVGGVSVTSVIAGVDVPRDRVLSAAHEIASAEAAGDPVSRCSLFDLPVGDAELWTISEERVETIAVDGREERCVAVLPAWEARSLIELEDPVLGFSTAAQVLADAMKLSGHDFEAKQSAMARYSRTGFEAAAVTSLGVLMSGRPAPRPGVLRTAELHFGHPFASVAATGDRYTRNVERSWVGLPVFSAWVARPVDAAE